MALSYRVRVVISLPHDLAAWFAAQAEAERRDKSKLAQILIEQYRESLKADNETKT